jgi:oligopeptide/dipeptide ABC transporter ATP-binding protein
VNGYVLQVEDLKVYYPTRAGSVKAVDGVTFHLSASERLGLVGESGCGKSTMALSLMRLIKPPGRIEGGRILLDGVDLARIPGDEMRKIRLNKISLIPQGAMNSLNPVMRIKQQIIDGMRAHHKELTQQELDERVEETLDLVGLEREVAVRYPHELSGGMKQRVCVAIAISLRPKVIIADEPTSALDVVVQKQVMETIEDLQQQLGAAVILIGHDMGLMAQFAERLAVMYAGRLVEVGKIREVFRHPLHPYTQLLINSVPLLDEKGSFRGIPGITPSLLDVPPGCNFHPRCPQAKEICSERVPSLIEVAPNRWVACHRGEV